MAKRGGIHYPVRTHGYGGYSRGCRCDTCTEAKRVYIATARSRAASRRELIEAGGGRYFVEGVTHGYDAYQNLACRCDECRAAKADQDRKRWGAS